MNMLRSGLSWAFIILFWVSNPSAALAQSYSTKDAQFVTNSRNDAVLRYIVCLELVAGTLPSSMSLDTRLARGEADCRSAAARLPKSAREPDVADIRGMILECGFRAGEASPDADCGGSSTANAPKRPGNKTAQRPGSVPRTSQRPSAPFVADDVDLPPRVIELGKWIEGVTYDGAYLWAAESGQRTVAKVDYRTGKIIERYKVGRLPIEVISTGSKDLYTLVATDQVVLKHDRRGQQTQLAKLKMCPSGMRSAGSDLFVLGEPDCSSGSSQLIRIEASKGRQQSSADLGEWSTSLTIAGSDVWVGHARGQALTIVDRATLKSRKLALPGIEVWALAANAKSVFAGGRYEGSDHDGSVVMVDARSRKEISRFSVTELVTRIAADNDKVVAIGNEGTIWILSAGDLSLVRTIRLGTGNFKPSSVSFNDNDLIVSTGQYRGENGAVFVLSDYMPKTFSRPSTNTSATNNPAVRPGAASGSRPPKARPGSEFPVLAGSLGGRVRAQATISAAQIASTSDGQPITLTRRTNKMLDGYPWFAIRLGNGDQGYQWGGIICSNRKPIAGTKGACAVRQPSRPNRPKQNSGASGQSGTRSSGGQANTADVIVGVLDLFGKIIDSQNKGNNGVASSGGNADIFRQTLRVDADTGGVSSLRDLNQNQLAIYTVRGVKGQKLQAEIWSQTQNSAFEIYINNAVKGGATLPGAGDSQYATFFEGELPLTGNYQIVVGSTGGQTSYELVVALQDPVPPYQASASAGAGNSQLVVGTYTSKTGRSGNVFLNEQTGALSWEEFCGANVPLTPDWDRSELVPAGGALRPFRLEVKGNKVTGFRSGKNRYVREDGVMMPGCAPAPGKNSGGKRNSVASSKVVDWTLAPQDPRESKDYSAVANAYWSICESANLDPNSPSYNNERAYWDCADEGLRQAAAAAGSGQNQNSGAANPVADWTLAPQDPRESKDYSAVPNTYWPTCENANYDPNSPAYNNEKAFWDCADEGFRQAAAGNGAVPVADPRAGKDYTSLPMGYFSTCAQNYGEGSSPYFDCLDSGLVTEAANLRVENEFSELSPQEIDSCTPDGYGTEAFFTCLYVMRDNKAGQQQGANGNSGTVIGQSDDPRASKDYTSLPMGYFSTCAQDHGEGSTPYFDCLDSGLLGEAVNLRVENEFSDLTSEEVQGCSTYGYGSGDFFNCLYAVRDNKAAQGATNNSNNQAQVELNPGGTYSDLDDSMLQTCQGDIGCLENYRAQIEENNRQAVDNRVASEFPDIDGEEIQGCTTYGYGTEDFFNCLYAVRESKAAQNAQEQAPIEDGNQQNSVEGGAADQQTVLSAMNAYCSSTYQGEQVSQCEQVLSECVYGYTDYNSAEFNQCVQSSGW